MPCHAMPCLHCPALACTALLALLALPEVHECVRLPCHALLALNCPRHEERSCTVHELTCSRAHELHGC